MHDCSSCSKYIYLSICYHNANWYHTESCCFICKGEPLARKTLECCNCRQMLCEKKSYKQVNEKPYCLSCFSEKFCKTCEKCLKKIQPNEVELMFDDKPYHADCFFCRKCSKSLENGKETKFYKDEENHPHCFDCYTRSFCANCFSCKKKIEASQAGILFLNNTFHHECFNCNDCKKHLIDEKGEKLKLFKGNNNMPICEQCYEKKNCKSCDKCHKLIGLEQTGVLFGNKIFHKETCFSCFKCDKNLVEEGPNFNGKYYKADHNPCCSSCYGKYCCKTCQECQQGIMPNMKSITFEKKDYHETCFKCCLCKVNIGTNEKKEFRVDDHKPYCIECYKKMFGKKCEKCSQVIKMDQTSTTFLNKDFHEKCFGCSNCNCQLKSEDPSSFKVEDEKIFCIECYRKLFCKACQSCKKGILGDEPKVIFEDRPFHKSCLCCDFCSKKIVTTSDNIKADNIVHFKNENNYPICQECFEAKYCKSCDNCEKKIITNQTVVTFEEKNYHSGCFTCSKCASKMLPDAEITKSPEGKLLCPKCSKKKEKTPPKGKAGPGKLNFNQIGSFEKTADIKCKTCKKSIIGQKFLTNKPGQFICKDCNAKNEASCFMCKKVFESREEFFKDEVNNNYCEKCIKIYQKSKKGN